MSTYIDSVDTPLLAGWMHAKDVVALHHKLRLPSISFLRDILDEAIEALADPTNQEKRVKLKNFNWCSVGSALTYEDTLIAKIAPKVMGRVEAIFHYEGGEWQTGLIIQDGKITECHVVQTLVPKT